MQQLKLLLAGSSAHLNQPNAVCIRHEDAVTKKAQD